MVNKLLATEQAIAFVKETFSNELCNNLNLHKVSSPIMVLDGTGINDDLNGVERTVTFPVKQIGDRKAVVVNSLAKWKRIRLRELNIEPGIGILTDMKAIRPDEDYSPIHSIYVDQWDWEKHITAHQRSLECLKSNVRSIYKALQNTEERVFQLYPEIEPILPREITFVHSEELAKQFPDFKPKERENKIAKKYGAVFIIGIGGKLSTGEPHDGRAPDYDDWSSPNDEDFYGLNGDLIVWNPVLQSALEISSMGIRVDREALLRQLQEKNDEDRKSLYFHQKILNDELPQSIGGGIGQSRVCMFLLRKKHIGEVQVGLWPDSVRKDSENEGINLL